MAITKKEIMDRLIALPTEIAAAEVELINLQSNLLDAQGKLQFLKDGLYIGVFEVEGKKIDGKNAEIRDAQLRQYTTIEQNEVTKATELVNRQRFVVTRLQNELIALRAVVELLKGAA